MLRKHWQFYGCLILLMLLALLCSVPGCEAWRCK